MSLKLLILKMFKRDNEEDVSYLKHEDYSKIANSSIDEQYIEDILNDWDIFSKLDQHNEVEVKEKTYHRDQDRKDYEIHDQLIKIVKTTLQKLNHAIDMVMNTQKDMMKMYEAKDSNKPLDFELEFNSRPHPFETFEIMEIPKLESIDRARYYELLIESKNNSALAYYLFKNNNLSRSSRAAVKSCFLKFI